METLLPQNKGKTDVALKLLRDSSTKDFEMDQLIGRSRLSVLEPLAAEDLAALIEYESVEDQALILAHIDAKKSFEVLEVLKDSAQVLVQISKLQPVPVSLLDEWNLILQEKLEQLGG